MGEVWRLVASNFAHNGFLHLAMNMLTLFNLANHLEPVVGTWTFLGIILHFSLSIGVLYVLAAQLLYVVERDASWLTYCSVGFSAVDFSLLVIVTEMMGDEPSLGGIVKLPPRVYPFAVAFLIQFLLPHISALGHGCGIAVGYLYSFGYLDALMLTRARAAAAEATCLKILQEWRVADLISTPSYLPRLPSTASSAFLMAQEAREREPGPWTLLARRLGVGTAACSCILPYTQQVHDYEPVAMQEEERQEGPSPRPPASSFASGGFPGPGLSLTENTTEADLARVLAESKAQAEQEERATTAYLAAGEEITMKEGEEDASREAGEGEALVPRLPPPVVDHAAVHASLEERMVRHREQLKRQLLAQQLHNTELGSPDAAREEPGEAEKGEQGGSPSPGS